MLTVAPSGNMYVASLTGNVFKGSRIRTGPRVLMKCFVRSDSSSGMLATHYLNVDLDILSRTPLEPLVAAMGSRVIVLFVGREGRRYGAHLEFAGYERSSNADTAIQGLAKIVRRLPPAARTLWRRASIREFNIGIQAGPAPFSFDLRLKPATLDAIRQIEATLAVTVYAPDVPVGGAGRKPRATRMRKHGVQKR